MFNDQKAKGGLGAGLVENYCSSFGSLPATESIALPENINPTKPPIQNQTGIKNFVPGRVQKPADTKANIDAGTKTLITKTISRTKYFMAPPEEMKFHPKRTKQSGFENPLKYLPAKTLIILPEIPNHRREPSNGGNR